MSFKVLVIPEDPSNNGYILKPLIEKIMRDCGKRNAQVTVLKNPRTQGFDNAVSLIENVVLNSYGHFPLLLFLCDADGVLPSREHVFRRLEQLAMGIPTRLICCAAIQEIEVWLLAGHRDRLRLSWPDIRSDVAVKENVFNPFLRKYGNPKMPGSGRAELMRTTLENYAALLRCCTELEDLRERISQIVA